MNAFKYELMVLANKPFSKTASINPCDIRSEVGGVARLKTVTLMMYRHTHYNLAGQLVRNQWVNLYGLVQSNKVQHQSPHPCHARYKYKHYNKL